MVFEQLKTIILNAGVVGAGGAGFPTQVKLSEKIDTFIVNAVECEPLIKADYFILKKHMSTLLSGIAEIKRSVNAKTAILGIKEHNAGLLSLKDGQILDEGVIVKTVRNIYPAGDEVILVYETTGRVIRSGTIPLTAGVMVMNAETVYNVAQAIEGKPVTDKFLTVAGHDIGNTTLNAPIGTPAMDILKACGLKSLEGMRVIDGGPMMGKLIDPHTYHINKMTKGLLVLPENHRVITSKQVNINAMTRRAPATCCQCRMCTDLCSRWLLGYDLEPHKIVRAVSNQDISKENLFLSAQICSGCGLCEMVACCQGISPKMVYTHIKQNMAANQLKYTSPDESPVPPQLREYRQVSSGRLIERIGFSAYAKEEAKWMDTPVVPQSVVLGMKQHLGIPAKAIVKPNEKVQKGMTVGCIDNGKLGANIHASVSGTVSFLEDGSIVIRTGGSYDKNNWDR